MTFFLIFLPALLAMAWALRCEFKRKFRTGTLTLCIVTALIILRFGILAAIFDGIKLYFGFHVAECIASMLIIPAMYMYLCNQCGSQWNNRESRIMLGLTVSGLFLAPFISIWRIPVWEFLNTTLRPAIIIIHCIIVGLCMWRLHRRIRRYGLKFNGWMKLYFVWMFFLLSFTIVSFATLMHQSGQDIMHFTFFIYYSIIVTTGYICVPGSFIVQPPIVTEDEDKPVMLDDFIKQKQILVMELRKLMTEERIFLKQSLFIDDVAKILGTNRTYITKIMRQEFGQTFNDFVNNSRVEHAKQLLLTTGMTIEEIANSTGYSSGSALCRAFKRITDSSPMAWKEENKAKQTE